MRTEALFRTAALCMVIIGMLFAGDVLDLLPVLKAADLPESPLFFIYDGHFNTAGHKIVADTIYNYLLANQLKGVLY